MPAAWRFGRRPYFGTRRFAMTIATEIRKSRWTGERIARLGFLLGLGWDAKRIADDPIIASIPNNVHRQAQRFGLAFRAAAAAMSLRPPDAACHFDAAAVKRGLTREADSPPAA
jgi:hypothetical protein